MVIKIISHRRGIMARKKVKLKDTHIAEKVRDELFTLEEQHLLNYQVGTLHVDIKDQLLHHYGEHYLILEEWETFLAFAQIKEEKGLYYLEKLKVLNERLKYMMIPANLYKTTHKEYTRDQTQSGENKGSSSNTSQYDNYGYSTTDNESENRNAQLGRNAAALNSSETVNLEKQMYDGLKQGSFGRKRKRKSITVNVDKGKLVDLGTKEEDVQTSVVEKFEGTKDLPHLYATQSISSGAALGESNSYGSSESIGLSKSHNESENNSEFHSTGTIRGGINVKDYVSTEADIQVLRMDIPRIRLKFWGIFWSLFTIRKY